VAAFLFIACYKCGIRDVMQRYSEHKIYRV